MNQHYFSLKNLTRFATVLITINIVLGISPLHIFPNLSQSVQAQENAEDYYNRGVAKYESGDFQGAIADCNQVILLAPNSAAVYQNRGVIYHRLDNNQQAITDFKKAAILFEKEGDRESAKQLQELITSIKESSDF